MLPTLIPDIGRIDGRTPQTAGIDLHKTAIHTTRLETIKVDRHVSKADRSQRFGQLTAAIHFHQSSQLTRCDFDPC